MDLEDKKIKWMLRRGMLELDTLLSVFFTRKYSLLSLGEKSLFVKLLSYEDDYLFRILMGHDKPVDKSVVPIVAAIQSSIHAS